MKIYGINNPFGSYKNNTKKTVSDKKISTEDKKDLVNISSTAKDIQTAYKSAMQKNEQNELHISTIQAQMKSGLYKISAEEVADKIINKGFDFKA